MTSRPTDPENLFYVGRQLAALGAADKALAALTRSISDGYYSYESLLADPAFDGIRDRPAFQSLTERARAGRDEALALFQHHNGARILAMGDRRADL